MNPELNEGCLKPIYSEPLYIQISNILRERLLSRSWQVGRILPNETELAREYGVSVGTMRKALQKLEVGGWILRRQGRGTFVADPQKVSQKRLNNFRMNGEVFPIDGLTILSCVVEQASAKIAQDLTLQRGEPVIRVKRKWLMDGLARIFEDVYIPRHALQNLSQNHDLSNIGCGELNDYDAFISRCEEVVRPAIAKPEIAKILEIEAATPVLECERIAYDVSDRPVECCVRTIQLEQLEYHVKTR